MAGLRVEGNSSGNVAEVDSNNNLKVVTPSVTTQTGYITALFENDAGTVTGTPSRLSPRVSPDYRLSIGRDIVVFNDVYNSTTQNTGVYRYIFTTMTTTSSGGSLLFNANSTLTASTGSALSTWRQFCLTGNGGLLVESVQSFTATVPNANQVWEWGLFPFGTAIAAPLDGVYLRFTSAGMQGFINFNGVETGSGVLTTTIVANTTYSWKIRINQRGVSFYQEDVLLGSILIPAGNGVPFLTEALSLSYHMRNSGTVSASPMQVKVWATHIDQRDIDWNKPWTHICAHMGQMGYQGQDGGVMGTTALYTNNLAPGAGAAMTNTTAALGTGLGGQFAALPTLTASTDGIVCSYQNPAGSVNQTPRHLIITGITIQSAVTTTLVGGPVQYVYALAFGHTAVSLATTETGSFVTATAKAPRVITLGIDNVFAAAATAPATGGTISRAFASPIVINPGEFVAVTAKNIGTVTSAGVITFIVTFDCYWD